MPSDRDLVQIVDSTMAQAVQVSGAWIACKPGCAACCMGPFPITQLDALRLKEGLASLAVRDPARAARVRDRAQTAVRRMGDQFPGNLTTGILDEGPEAEERFETLPEEEPCPALDPDTGTCDLYESRPITCRTFGPAVSWGSDALGTCELCYQGATDDQIAACRVDIDPAGMEDQLIADLEVATGRQGQTTVAFACLTPGQLADLA
jgi:Fe-S-cluster containining protein